MANFGYFFMFLMGAIIFGILGYWFGRKGKNMVEQQWKDFLKELPEDFELMKDKINKKIKEVM